MGAEGGNEEEWNKRAFHIHNQSIVYKDVFGKSRIIYLVGHSNTPGQDDPAVIRTLYIDLCNASV